MIALSEWKELAVAERAEQLLNERDGRFARCVSCTWLDGTLRLHGRVPSWYLKQIAQTVVARIEGVERIDNRIEVFARPAPRRAWSDFADDIETTCPA